MAIVTCSLGIFVLCIVEKNVTNKKSLSPLWLRDLSAFASLGSQIYSLVLRNLMGSNFYSPGGFKGK